MENKTRKKIKVLHIDNGGKYMEKTFKELWKRGHQERVDSSI